MCGNETLVLCEVLLLFHNSLGNGGKVVGVKPLTSQKKVKILYGEFLSIPSRLDSVQ